MQIALRAEPLNADQIQVKDCQSNEVFVFTSFVYQEDLLNVKFHVHVEASLRAFFVSLDKSIFRVKKSF